MSRRFIDMLIIVFLFVCFASLSRADDEFGNATTVQEDGAVVVPEPTMSGPDNVAFIDNPIVKENLAFTLRGRLFGNKSGKGYYIQCYASPPEGSFDVYKYEVPLEINYGTVTSISEDVFNITGDLVKSGNKTSGGRFIISKTNWRLRKENSLKFTAYVSSITGSASVRVYDKDLQRISKNATQTEDYITVTIPPNAEFIYLGANTKAMFSRIEVRNIYPVPENLKNMKQ